MKIVAISDTHLKLRALQGKMPDGDVLVHAGDLTGRGTSQEIHGQLKELSRLAEKYKSALFIAGNHDHLFETHPGITANMLKDFPKLTYLEDKLHIIDGVKFYGSPWTPNFCDWAFMPERNSEELQKKWERIPTGVDVLITHGPPCDILDDCNRARAVGCAMLRDEIKFRIRPKVHVFGHIHEGYGVLEQDGTKYINASICDENYVPSRLPIVFEL